MSARLTHDQKIKLARSMLTAEEQRRGVSIFDSVAWNNRRETKRIKTMRSKYGDSVFKDHGLKGNKVAGGKASPQNFKNNKELASKAGKASAQKRWGSRGGSK